jgi:hypothetical protein
LHGKRGGRGQSDRATAIKALHQLTRTSGISNKIISIAPDSPRDFGKAQIPLKRANLKKA